MRKAIPGQPILFWRRWGRLLAFCALVAGSIGLFVGCSDPVARYRALSFFFDGVPVPEQLQGEVSMYDPRQIPPGERAELKPPDQPQVTFYHEPYATRNCFGCHDRERGYGKMIGGDRQVCQRCHRDYFQPEPNDWMHGPVVMGECQLCHEAHKSTIENLLTQDQPPLCFDCHSARFIAEDPFHAPLDDLTCSRCHDPHAAGNRLLLADSRTYQRRRGEGLTAVSEHPEWTREQCEMCHVVGESNRLVDDVDSICLTCHQDQVDQARQGAHQPIAEGRCNVCHTPHKSPRPNLIHPTAEKICLTCHKPDEFASPPHPNVTRVDCLMCHRGHDADRDHLLRPGVGLVGPVAPVEADEQPLPDSAESADTGDRS